MNNLRKFGDGISFRRLCAYLELQGIARRSLSERSILVVGSNGKGSTSNFIASALSRQFERVGHFTSPHLFKLSERFKISGTPIAENVLQQYYSRVLEFASSLSSDNRLGRFEALFLLACQWFHDQNAECIVWEAGIGGRYDPTRVVGASIGVLTSVELEHVELLGSSRELIAYDKLDGVASGGTVVISESVDRMLDACISTYCSISDRKPLFMADRAPIIRSKHDERGTSFSFRTPDGLERNVGLKMLGDYQAENAVAAFEAAKLFMARRNKSQSDERLIQSMEAAVWPGRLQKISENPSVWIDIGHTPDAIRRTIGTWLSVFSEESTLAVVGVSVDKNVQGIVKAVDESFSKIIVTSAKKNGFPSEDLKQIFAKREILLNRPTIQSAVADSIKIAESSGLQILVIGSLFSAIEFKCVLDGNDPKDLDFF